MTTDDLNGVSYDAIWHTLWVSLIRNLQLGKLENEEKRTILVTKAIYFKRINIIRKVYFRLILIKTRGKKEWSECEGME